MHRASFIPPPISLCVSRLMPCLLTVLPAFMSSTPTIPNQGLFSQRRGASVADARVEIQFVQFDKPHNKGTAGVGRVCGRRESRQPRCPGLLHATRRQIGQTPKGSGAAVSAHDDHLIVGRECFVKGSELAPNFPRFLNSRPDGCSNAAETTMHSHASVIPYTVQGTQIVSEKHPGREKHILREL
jgi:hypothetical protein